MSVNFDTLIFADDYKQSAPAPRIGGSPDGIHQDDAVYNQERGEGSRNPFKSPSKTKSAVAQAKRVNCHNKGITVSLEKSIVRVGIVMI